MKKSILIIITLIFIVTNSYSQDFVKELQDIRKVKILDFYGNLNIEGVSLNKIEINKEKQKSLPVNANLAKPEYYKNDNTQIGLCFEHYEGIVIISPANQKSQFTNYSLKIPKTAMLEIKTGVWSGRLIEIIDTSIIKVRNIQAEINIEAFTSNIELSEITGPLALAELTGNCYIDFSELNQNNPSSIEVIFGKNIDVILPEKTNFDINFYAQNGEIFSEFDIDINVKESIYYLRNFPPGYLKNKAYNSSDKFANLGRKLNEPKVIGKVNKGGVRLSVTTFDGNINLKKK